MDATGTPAPESTPFDATMALLARIEADGRARLRAELEKQRSELERHIAAGEASIAKSQLRLAAVDEQLAKLSAEG